MKCSIIIPFYNELDLIDRAVRSAVAQSTDTLAIEVVIANDGQSPEEGIRERIGADIRPSVRVIKNTGPHGPGGARNAALSVCTGDLIAFLDADDYWRPGKLAAQLEDVAAGATFVATGYSFDGTDRVIRPPTRIDAPKDVFLQRGIGTSTVLLTRELLAEHRFRDIRFAQDIDFWFALSNAPNFRYAARPDGLVVYSTGGSTRNKFVQLSYVWRILRLNRVGPALSARVLWSYGFAGLYRHYIEPLSPKFFPKKGE